LTDHGVSSHLRQAGSAILAVEQVDKRQHDRTSLFDHGANAAPTIVSGGFRGQAKAVSSGVKMVSS
jgi:hypothetical protein